MTIFNWFTPGYWKNRREVTEVEEEKTYAQIIEDFNRLASEPELPPKAIEELKSLLRKLYAKHNEHKLMVESKERKLREIEEIRKGNSTTKTSLIQQRRSQIRGFRLKILTIKSDIRIIIHGIRRILSQLKTSNIENHSSFAEKTEKLLVDVLKVGYLIEEEDAEQNKEEIALA